jgi:hypothetical protein
MKKKKEFPKKTFKVLKNRVLGKKLKNECFGIFPKKTFLGGQIIPALVNTRNFFHCPNVPKKREDWGGRHNFFCICRLARLKIHVRGLLLYFQKNKKFLKLPNFSRTCTPLKIENHEKNFFLGYKLLSLGKISFIFS